MHVLAIRGTKPDCSVILCHCWSRDKGKDFDWFVRQETENVIRRLSLDGKQFIYTSVVNQQRAGSQEVKLVLRESGNTLNLSLLSSSRLFRRKNPQEGQEKSNSIINILSTVTPFKVTSRSPGIWISEPLFELSDIWLFTCFPNVVAACRKCPPKTCGPLRTQNGILRSITTRPAAGRKAVLTWRILDGWFTVPKFVSASPSARWVEQPQPENDCMMKRWESSCNRKEHKQKALGSLLWF